MVLSVKKGVISGRCNACGAKNDLDNTHKLAAFIVKNPPDNKSELKKGTTDDKNGKKTDAKEPEKVGEKQKATKTKSKEKDEENEKNDGHNSEEEGKLPSSKARHEDYNVDSKKISKSYCYIFKIFSTFFYSSSH